MEFMAVSSYGSATTSSGVVRILKDLDRDIAGEHVLIVEDIIDSGLTLSWLLKNLRSRNPASIEIVALLRKPDAVKVDVQVQYVGFDIPNEFVVGYGLDYAERYRDLPYIGRLKTRGLQRPDVYRRVSENPAREQEGTRTALPFVDNDMNRKRILRSWWLWAVVDPSSASSSCPACCPAAAAITASTPPTPIAQIQAGNVAKATSAGQGTDAPARPEDAGSTAHDKISTSVPGRRRRRRSSTT